MPFGCNVMISEKMAIVTAHGHVDIATIIETITTLAAYPDFYPDFSVLVDLRKMEFEPETTDTGEVADVLGDMKKWYNGKIAVVLNKRLLWPVRMTSVMAEVAGFKIKPFTDTDEAREWLKGKPAGKQIR